MFFFQKYFNGQAQKALLALIQYSRNSNLCFADLLNSLLKVLLISSLFDKTNVSKTYLYSLSANSINN